MLARKFLDIGLPVVLGLLIVLAGYRSRQPRRDLMLLAIPAFLWILVHLTLMTPPTSSPFVNFLLLVGPLVIAFAFLARRWRRLERPSDHWLPNPRLQRTRSALLRSPLSRKPLGVT